MLDRLLNLQERGRTLVNSGRAAASVIIADATLSREITALYSYYFGRGVSGCKNCLFDALVELCLISKKKAMSKSEIFVMRRGVVLKDTINRDARKNLVRGNETDELALYHLYTNPNAAKFFETLPDKETLGAMLAEFGEAYEKEQTDKTGLTPAERVSEDAKDRAREIVAEATTEANKIVEDAKADAEKIKADAIAEATTEANKIVEDAEKAKADTVTASKKTGSKSDPIMK